MTVKLTFGEWLGDALADESRGFSRDGLAKAATVSLATVSRWVSNKRRPHAKACDAIADYLGIDRNEVRRRAGRPEIDDRAVAEVSEPYVTDIAPNGVDDRRRRLLRKMDGFTAKELDLVEVIIDQIRRNRQGGRTEVGSETGSHRF